MLRSGASRAAFRALNSATQQSSRPVFNTFQTVPKFTAKLCTLSHTRPQAFVRPFASTTIRSMAVRPIDNIDEKHEAEVGKEKLEAHPEVVSASSSTHPLFAEVGKPEEEHDTDMMAGIRSDMKTIQETFSLQDVPREAYYVGMAGVLPYMATSLSTVYCAWEIKHSATHGSGFFLSEETAEAALHVIEPLQVGYGAVIISFLGAIHWGLEWAGFGGHQGYPRYMIGVIAPAVAWPTTLLPAEYALITQFLAFNFLYYTDSRATKRGWAPAWYGVYRFVLTFIVGSAIVASLIGRGQIADRIGALPGPADRIKALRESRVAESEAEEKARQNKVVSEDEDDEE